MGLIKGGAILFSFRLAIIPCYSHRRQRSLSPPSIKGSSSLRAPSSLRSDTQGISWEGGRGEFGKLGVRRGGR